MKSFAESLRATLSAAKAAVYLGAFLVLLFGAFRSHAGDAPVLRANYAAFSGAFAPLWIAADKNLFSKYGLNVDIRYIAPGTATQALIGKNLDIINPGGEIIEAGLNGESVAYIAGILNRAVMSIYAKPEITSIADLKGKVLALTVPGATTDFAARVLLQCTEPSGFSTSQSTRMSFSRWSGSGTYFTGRRSRSEKWPLA